MTDDVDAGFDYPPREHVLRDLPFEMESVDELRSRAYLELGPHVCADAGVSVGALTTVVDVLGGSLTGRVVAPDWMATADLTLHLGDVTAPTGVIVADARVIRNGRNTIVTEVDVSHMPDPTSGGGGGPRSCGEALLTFVRLPRRDTTLDMSSVEVRYGELMSFAVEGSGLAMPFIDRVGLEVTDGRHGVTSTPASEYIRNSFGAVNGGVVAALADAAALAVGRAHLGGPVRTVDIAVHYLVQGKSGPFATRSSVVRHGGDSVLVRVEVLDTGNPGPDGDPAVMVVAQHVRRRGVMAAPGAVVVRDAVPADVPAITSIYNSTVAETTVSWTDEPDSVEYRRSWLAARRAAGDAVLVAVIGDDVVGFAAYGDFRDSAKWPGYRFTVEHSVHVSPHHRGHGIGHRLMEALIDRAATAGIHVMVGGIDGDNEASVRFHERLGFVTVARLSEVGFKFGRWLDLVLMQRIIGEATDEFGGGRPFHS